jgi:hypothetical protein
MPTYRVNDAAVKQAKALIDDGKFDDETEWSDAAPDAGDSNKEIDKESFDEFAKWHLAIDPDATEGTKKSVAFPYGDFSKVNRAERPRRDREGRRRRAGLPGPQARVSCVRRAAGSPGRGR